MYKLMKLNIHDVALHSFVVYLVLGIIFLIPLGIITMTATDEAVSAGYEPFLSREALPALLIFLFPFIYALLGTCINTLLALLLNFFSKKSGGININLESRSK